MTPTDASPRGGRLDSYRGPESANHNAARARGARGDAGAVGEVRAVANVTHPRWRVVWPGVGIAVTCSRSLRQCPKRSQHRMRKKLVQSGSGEDLSIQIREHLPHILSALAEAAAVDTSDNLVSCLGP